MWKNCRLKYVCPFVRFVLPPNRIQCACISPRPRLSTQNDCMRNWSYPVMNYSIMPKNESTHKWIKSKLIDEATYWKIHNWITFPFVQIEFRFISNCAPCLLLPALFCFGSAIDCFTYTYT